MKRLKIAAIFIFTVLYLCEQRCGALEIGQQNKNAKRDGSVQREDGSSVPTNVKRAAAVSSISNGFIFCESLTPEARFRAPFSDCSISVFAGRRD